LAPFPEADAFAERAFVDRGPLFGALDLALVEPDFAFVEFDCLVVRDFVLVAILISSRPRIPRRARTPVYTQ
jgi:hypothetical protein